MRSRPGSSRRSTSRAIRPTRRWASACSSIRTTPDRAGDLGALRALIARIGPRPTLIERDDNLPAFDELVAERDRAAAVLRAPMLRAA